VSPRTLFHTPFDKKTSRLPRFGAVPGARRLFPRQIPVCAWPRFHAHSDNSELWCPVGCCKELRARRQGRLELRVGSRHVACGEDRRAARMRASGSHCPPEERSVVGGTHRKIRAWCAVQFGAESGPCALPCTAAGRSMDASWRAESRLSSPRLGSRMTSAWLTVDRNVACLVSRGVCKEQGSGERVAWSQD
jgi:hypothetical protein